MKFPAEQTSCETLLKPLKESLYQLYSLKQIGNHANYNGYDMHCSVGCCSLPPVRQLSQRGLKDNMEQGLEPIDVILLLAFQLGYSNAAVKYEADIKQINDLYEILKRLDV